MQSYMESNGWHSNCTRVRTVHHRSTTGSQIISKTHRESPFCIFCGKVDIATSVYRCLSRSYCADCIHMYNFENAGFLAIMWNEMQEMNRNAYILMKFGLNALQSVHTWKGLPPT